MGGGGFTMAERSPGLDRLVLEATGRPIPRICFLPTASGDPREQVMHFYERFGSWPCEPNVLSLFHIEPHIDPVQQLLAQDAIYVGGGSMRNLLAVWHAHGVDGAMRAAWERGTLLAGLSAGAMCWFQGGISKSRGAPEPVSGLGLLAGSMSVHLGSEPERLPAYRRAVASGELPSGYAVDDGAALLYEGTRLVDCVGSRAEARVLRVRADGCGGVIEQDVEVRPLPYSEASATHSPRGGELASGAGEDEDGIAEMRALRAGRRRWE